MHGFSWGGLRLGSSGIDGCRYLYLAKSWPADRSTERRRTTSIGPVRRREALEGPSLDGNVLGQLVEFVYPGSGSLSLTCRLCDCGWEDFRLHRSLQSPFVSGDSIVSLPGVDWEEDALGSFISLTSRQEFDSLLVAFVDSRRLIMPGFEDFPFANIPFFVSGLIYRQLYLTRSISVI